MSITLVVFNSSKDTKFLETLFCVKVMLKHIKTAIDHIFYIAFNFLQTAMLFFHAVGQNLLRSLVIIARVAKLEKQKHFCNSKLLAHPTPLPCYNRKHSLAIKIHYLVSSLLYFYCLHYITRKKYGSKQENVGHKDITT